MQSELFIAFRERRWYFILPYYVCLKECSLHYSSLSSPPSRHHHFSPPPPSSQKHLVRRSGNPTRRVMNRAGTSVHLDFSSSAILAFNTTISSWSLLNCMPYCADDRCSRPCPTLLVLPKPLSLICAFLFAFSALILSSRTSTSRSP